MNTVSKSAPSEPKGFRIFFILLGTLIVWGFKWFECKAAGPKLSDSFGAIRVLAEALGPSHFVVAMIVSFGILIVSHVRVMSGIEFSDQDTTFLEAIKAAFHTSEKQEQAKAFIHVVTGIVAGNTVLLAYVVGVKHPGFVPGLLFLQAVLIVYFDYCLWPAFSIDTDRDYSYIIWADVLLLCISVLWLYTSITPQITHACFVFGAAFGSYIFIALMEGTKSYWKSWKTAFKDGRQVVRMAWGFRC